MELEQRHHLADTAGRAFWVSAGSGKVTPCSALREGLTKVHVEEKEQLTITQEEPGRLSVIGQWMPPIGRPVELLRALLRSSEVKVSTIEETPSAVWVKSIRQVVKVQVPVAWVRSSLETNVQINAYV